MKRICAFVILWLGNKMISISSSVYKGEIVNIDIFLKKMKKFKKTPKKIIAVLICTGATVYPNIQ